MNRRWKIITWLSITTTLLFACSTHLNAQATPTATAPADISFFAGYGRTPPDYDAGSNPTVTFGADFTHYFKFPIVPSLEARANLANGKYVSERSYLFGIRAEPKWHSRFHPYGDFLLGPGNLHFVTPSLYPGYVGDNSVVKSIGGGVEFDVYSHFQIKADAQYQFWKFDSNFTLTPTIYTIGVNYHLRSRNSKPR